MKKKQDTSVHASALQIALALALLSVSAILFASTLSQATGVGPGPNNPQPDRPMPAVVGMVGPVMLNTDLRDLPYVPPKEEFEERRLMRYPFPLSGSDAPAGSGTSSYVQRLLK